MLTWIISSSLPNHESTRGHNLHVATLRVIRVDDSRPIPLTQTDVQDEEVVTMEMHWMRQWCLVVDDEAVGTVAADVDDVPVRGIVRGVACGGEEEHGTIVVCAQRGAVHGPEPVQCAVGADGDVECDGGGGCGRFHGVDGNSLVERIVVAGIWVWVGRRCRCWYGAGVGGIVVNGG